MPISEMQARWICQVWKGNVGLPTKEDMQKDIDIKIKEMRKRYLNRSRHTIQVDFSPYMDEIAELIGAKPSFLKNIAYLKELLFSPIFPIQYRLNGPHAWSGASEELKKQYHQVFYERPEKEASYDIND